MKLQAQKRSTTEKLSVIREQHMIPAVVYGSDVESTAISLTRKEFVMMYKQAGGSSIIDLDVDGESHEVLIKQIDRDPVSEDILHVDLYAIKRGVEMEVTIPLVFVGESPAAKAGGILNEVMHELTVSCLPRNMVSEIEIDLSVMVDMGSQITVGDLNLSEGITPQAGAEETIVAVSEPSAETEEESSEDAQAAVDAVLAEKEDSEDSDSE